MPCAILLPHSLESSCFQGYACVRFIRETDSDNRFTIFEFDVSPSLHFPEASLRLLLLTMFQLSVLVNHFLLPSTFFLFFPFALAGVLLYSRLSIVVPGASPSISRMHLRLVILAVAFLFGSAYSTPPSSVMRPHPRHFSLKLRRGAVSASPALRINNGSQPAVFDATLAVSTIILSSYSWASYIPLTAIL